MDHNQKRRTERDIQYDIRRALRDYPEARLFRLQSGRFWQGTVVEEGGDYVVLRNPRRIQAGFEGLADLGGWIKQRITPAMVGMNVARFAAIEVKNMNEKPTSAQQAFLFTVGAHGGLAGVARSVEDARRILMLG